MAYKKSSAGAFITRFGQVNRKTLGKGLELDNLSNVVRDLEDKTKATSSHFEKGAKTILNMLDLTKQGLRSDKLIAGAIEGTIKGFINSTNEMSPLIGSNSVINLGTTAEIIETHIHVGKKTSERLKKSRNTPNIDYENKELSSSSKDYQAHKKRKNLTLKAGFEEKGFCFLMEDTYLTVDELYKLYLKDNLGIQKSIKKNKNDKREIYGAAYKIVNEVRIMNRMEFYDANIRIHLVKLTDHEDSVRTLVRDITNNKFNTKLENDNSDQYTRIEQTSIRRI